MALTDNLLEYYKLDGNSNDSIGSNNGTDSNITYSVANGKIDQGAGFNGSSSKINTPLQSLSGGAFTISAWVNFSSFSAANCVFSQGNTGSNNQMISLKFNSSIDLELVYRDDSSVGLVDTGTISALSTGTWYHICWVCTTTNSKLYINNVKVADTNFTANTGTMNTQNIGVRIRLATDAWMNGAIDEVGIWNRAISTNEISDLYNGGSGLSYPFIKSNPISNLLTLGVG